jgi:serine/threonine protein kinase
LNLYRKLTNTLQLVDVANGLKYLHDLQIVHGDLRGVPVSLKLIFHASHLTMKANVLINRDKRACLADFGLVTATSVAARAAARSSQLSLSTIDSLMSFTPGGTFRWMSPELLDPERFLIPQSDESDRPTTQSDCYAFGMVIYEVSIRVNEPVVVDGQVIYPRSYVDTALTLRSRRIFSFSMRS